MTQVPRPPRDTSAPLPLAQRDRDPGSGRALDGLVVATKLEVPHVREGVVARPRLIGRLEAVRDRPVVAVVAPAGYGKSTLLAQIAAGASAPVAWYTADQRDRDPAVLVLGLAAAFDRIAPLAPDVVDAVLRPGASVWTKAMPKLADAVHRAGPWLLVIDEMDQIRDREAVEVIVTLADRLGPGKQVIVAGRTEGEFPLPRLVVAREAGVIEREDLALDPTEADAVLSAAGSVLPADEVEGLVRRTEGWAAAIYLAAVARARAGTDGTEPATDRWVGDYVRSEVLASLDPDDRSFLARTSSLERLSGELCDAVLQRTGSGAVLDRLERSNRLVTALDRERSWFHLHPVVADVLRAERRDRDGDDRKVQRLAVEWHATHGMAEAALEYAILGDDPRAVERILATILQSTLNAGRHETLRRWLDWLESKGPADPAVAVVASAIIAIDGDAGRSMRWLALAEAIGPPPGADRRIDGMRALGRALAMTNGAAQMATDAATAVDAIPGEDVWYPAAMMLASVAAVIQGMDGADARIDAAIGAYERHGGAHIAGVAALSMRAFRAVERGDTKRASVTLSRARQVMRDRGLEELPLAGLLDAMSARLAIRRGGAVQARADLAHAQRLRPQLTRAILWLSILTRLEMAHTMLALDDPGGARFLLLEIRDLLDPIVEIGHLEGRIAALEAALEHRSGVVSASTLSGAELRLLPLLTTQLTFREIGTRLYLSSNTIKTQAISIYRKLDATTRTEAVEQATALGLIDGRLAAH
jgi:LuxR family transcriptional regulator, maltose regulon positive regulatory protein